MSKERELLRRAKCLLECSNMEPLQRQSDNIVGEIKELLEQPEQAEIAHGNVFSDLGFDPVEAAELQANSNRIISKKLDQSQPETEGLIPQEIITAYQMLVRRKLGLQEKNEGTIRSKTCI